MKDIFDKKITNLFGEEVSLIKDKKSELEKKFIIPPFSVLDTKQGYWQDRKRAWLDLGIKSEVGRGDNLTFNLDSFNYEDDKKIQKIKTGKCLPAGFDPEKYGVKQAQATSIFDPVLCEICYKWFNIEKGAILDVFAGGSVRGVVAEYLGYQYNGIDLSEKQIEANKENAKMIFGENHNIKWYNDDSLNVDNYIKDNSVDMIFSCPPYYDLEVYSDKPNDLSNMEYEQFRKTYIEIICRACKKLKNNRFAVFVVGDMRDKEGYYRNFVDLTKYAFNKGGMKLWNEAILLNALGTAMIRCSSPFNSNRKLTKVHQNVLIFYKGDVKEIRNNYKVVCDEN